MEKNVFEDRIDTLIDECCGVIAKIVKDNATKIEPDITDKTEIVYSLILDKNSNIIMSIFADEKDYPCTFYEHLIHQIKYYDYGDCGDIYLISDENKEYRLDDAESVEICRLTDYLIERYEEI